MPLTPGTKLGPYEILAPIGAGGMGEVYKAKDTRLDRTVAIKVLPEHLSTNVELKKRFEQEARAVSSLNHPNICTLYDIGHEDGVDFMVMEYIEGETLAELVAKGALSPEQALKYAIEIADALDKAHREGVVHRDLKPGNIIITKKGAKLLDFGLATRVRDTSPDDSAPTQAKPLTREGTILGTFQYMAPEQLESKETDGRTDIFAFGAMLYEMLTGRKAFQGESQASLITAIMSSEPEAVTDLVPMTPPALDRFVQRCLAKDPDDRWQTARDVTIELEWIRDRPDPASIASKGSGRRTERAAWTLGLVIATAIAALVVFGLTRPDPPRVMRFTTEADRLYQRAGEFAKITPDGSTLVYIGESDGTAQVFRRSFDEVEATLLPGAEFAQSVFLSPDSQWVGFWASGVIKKMSLSGGPAVTVSETVSSRGISWGNDGTIVFGSPGGGLWRVPDTGGEPEPMTEAPAGFGHNRPFHLPDAKGLLFTVWSPEDPRIAVLPQGSRDPRVLLSGTTPHITPSGHLVFQRGGALWAVPFDVDRLDVDGVPVPVIEGVEVTGQGTGQFDIARDGTLIYVPSSAVAGRRIIWMDRSGGVTTAVEAVDAREFALAPDGQRIAASVRNQGIWVFDTERRSRFQLPVDQLSDLPTWSPDGRRIAYQSNSSATLDSIVSDGSAEPELLADKDFGPFSWSPDGLSLAVHTQDGDIWVVPVGGEPKPWLTTPAYEGGPKISPDGRFMAYFSDESGQNEIHVQPFSGSGGRWTVSTDGGTDPVWSKDGRELFYRSEGRMMAVDVRTEPTFSAGTPRTLLDAQQLAGYADPFDVSLDGERFVLVEDESAGLRRSLMVVLNWTEELKRLVP